MVSLTRRRMRFDPLTLLIVLAVVVVLLVLAAWAVTASGLAVHS